MTALAPNMMQGTVDFARATAEVLSYGISMTRADLGALAVTYMCDPVGAYSTLGKKSARQFLDQECGVTIQTNRYRGMIFVSATGVEPLVYDRSEGVGTGKSDIEHTKDQIDKTVARNTQIRMQGGPRLRGPKDGENIVAPFSMLFPGGAIEGFTAPARRSRLYLANTLNNYYEKVESKNRVDAGSASLGRLIGLLATGNCSCLPHDSDMVGPPEDEDGVGLGITFKNPNFHLVYTRSNSQSTVREMLVDLVASQTTADEEDIKLINHNISRYGLIG